MLLIFLQCISDVSVFEKAIQEMNRAPELNYMTQIVFMLYEDVAKKNGEKGKFMVDIRFSPGVKLSPDIAEEADNGAPQSIMDLMKTSPELPKLSTFVKRLPVDNQPSTTKPAEKESRSRNRKLSCPGVMNTVSTHSNQKWGARESVIFSSMNDPLSNRSNRFIHRRKSLPGMSIRDMLYHRSTSGKNNYYCS